MDDFCHDPAAFAWGWTGVWPLARMDTHHVSERVEIDLGSAQKGPKSAFMYIYDHLISSNYVPQRRFGPVLFLFIFDSCWTATVRSCVLRTDRRETQQRTVLGCRTTVRSACSCRPSTWVRGPSSWFATPSATSKFSSKKYANCRSPIRSMPPMKFPPPGTTFLVLDFFILGSHMRSTWQVRLRKTVPWVVARKCANSASNWWGSPAER